MLRRSLLRSLLALVAIAVSAIAHAAEPTTDSLEIVKKNIAEKKAVLVDVRSEKEWTEGHVEGAIHLPIAEIKKVADNQAALLKLLTDKLPKDKIIYVHCGAGGRAKQACTIGAECGLDLRALKPGYKALLEAGFAQAKAADK